MSTPDLPTPASPASPHQPTIEKLKAEYFLIGRKSFWAQFLATLAVLLGVTVFTTIETAKRAVDSQTVKQVVTEIEKLRKLAQGDAGVIATNKALSNEIIAELKRLLPLQDASGNPLIIHADSVALTEHTTKSYNKYSLETYVGLPKDKFEGPPLIFTALSGDSGHHVLTGITSIYNREANQFSFLLRGKDALSLQSAISANWKIMYIAVGKAKPEGK